MRFKLKNLFLAACLLAALGTAALYAAVPGRVSYQGTLRKSGVLFNGTAAMEFTVTNADGSQTYWTSGSTNVPVSGGLFRYQLGSPNEAQFAAVSWGDIVPYVQVKIDGGWLPREPLFSSPYSLHAFSAESSSGTFTVYGGDLQFPAAGGTHGIVFQDGTAQYSAAGWAVSGANVYVSQSGNAGIGIAAPQARLDVQAAPAAYAQIWRNSSGVIQASMTAGGVLYADGAQLRNVTAGGGGSSFNYVLAQNLATGSNWISNDGASRGLNIDVSGNVGVGQAAGAARLDVSGSVSNFIQFWRNNSGVIQASMTAQGALYADGSQLRNVARDNLGNHTATQNLNLATRDIVGVSTITVGYLTSQGAGVVFTTNALVMGGSLGVDTQAPQEKLHVNGNILSSNLSGAANRCVYVDAAGVLRAKGSDCGLASPTGDNLGSHTATQNLNLGTNWLSPDNSAKGIALGATGNVGVGMNTPAARLDVQPAGGDTYSQLWRDSSGVIQASMTASGIIYADASKMRNLPAGGLDNLGNHTATQNLNLATKDIVGVSTITVGYLTSQGAGVVFTTNALVMGGSLGVDTQAPQEKLHVNGNILSTTLSGAANRCVYVDAAGVLRAKGSDCGLASPTGDNLGSHTATQNLNMAGNQILDAASIKTAAIGGTGAGVQVSTDLVILNGSLGVDAAVPQEKLHVNGNILSSSLSGSGNRCVYADNGGVLRLSGDACGLAGVSGDNLGSHVLSQNLVTGSNWLSGDGNNEGLLIDANGNVSVTDTLYAPAGRLDVRGSVNGYTQVWRNFAGVVQASVSAAGFIYADGSQLRNLPSSADNLGNHTASSDLLMAGFAIRNAGSITAGGPVTAYSSFTVAAAAGAGLPKIRFTPAVEISSAPALQQGGVYVSSHVYLPAGARYYGDGSALTALNASGLASGTVNDGRLSANVALLAASQNFSGVNTFASSITVTGAAGAGLYRVGFAPGVEISSTTAARYGGVYVSSNIYLPAGAVYYGNGSGLTGVTDPGAVRRAGDTMTGQLTLNGSTLTVTGNSFSVTGANFMVSAAGNVGVGVISPGSRLQVNDSDGNVATSGMKFDNFTCSGTDKLTVDAGGMLVCSPDQTGSGSGNLVDSLFDTLGAGSDAGGRSVLNAGNSAFGRASAAVRLDVQPAGGDTYSQVWRNSTGVEQASMTAAGILYADGSQLRNLPPGADNMGSHTASQNVDMAGFKLLNVSTLTAAAGQPGVMFSGNALVAGDLSGAGRVLYGNLAYATDVSTVITAVHRFVPTAGVYNNYLYRGYVDADPPFDMDGAPARTLYGASFESAVKSGSFNKYGSVTGVSGLARHYGLSSLDFAYGVQGIAADVATGPLGAAYGGFFGAVAGLTGVFDNAVGAGYGVYAQNAVYTNASAMTNSYAVFAQTPAGFPGRMTNNYGVFINDQSGMGTVSNFNLYSAGAASRNYFAGQVGIGTLAPAASLQVSSAAAYAGDMVLISTGSSNVIRMTGGGEVYATRFIGDGSGLTGVAGAVGMSNPATANFDVNSKDVNNVANLHTSGMTVDNVTTLGESITVSTNVLVNASVGIQYSLIVGDGQGMSAPVEISGDGSNALMRVNSNGGGYCTILIDGTGACTGATILGANNGMALCLLCTP
jgi:hypothetical protein